MTRPADGGAAAAEHAYRLTPVTTRRGRPRLWMDADVRCVEPAPAAPQPERRGIEVPDSLVQKERKAAWDEIGRALDALERSPSGISFNRRIRPAS